MPQIDIDGANSRLSADNIRGQSGSTITIVSGHNLVGSGSGLTALPAANLTGTLPAISGVNLTALNATQLTSGTLPIARLGNDVIDSQHYAAASIDNEHLADDAVGVAELSATGTASSSTFLRGDNAWAEAGGGAWELLSSQTASTTASLTQTGLSTTYENYAFVLCDLVPTTSGADCWIRLGDSSGIDSGASDYGYHQQQIADASASYIGYPDTAASHMLVATAVSHYGGGAMSGLFYMQRPTNTTVGSQILPCIHGNHVNVNHPHLAFVGGSVYGVRKSVNMAVDRVQVLFSTGNISSGTFAVYGISKT